MLIVFIGKPLCPKEYFSNLLAVAAIINGVFGNVFPVAAAAYSEQINNPKQALQLGFLCRYGALVLPFLLRLPHFTGFLIALILNQVSLLIIAYKFKDRGLAKE